MQLGNAQSAAQERSLLEISNHALRLALESVLRELAETQDDVVEVDDARYRRHQKATLKYHSLCGQLRVERWAYRLIAKAPIRSVRQDLETHRCPRKAQWATLAFSRHQRCPHLALASRERPLRRVLETLREGYAPTVSKA